MVLPLLASQLAARGSTFIGMSSSEAVVSLVATSRKAFLPFYAPLLTITFDSDSQIEDSISVMNDDFASTGLSFNLVNITHTTNSDWFGKAAPGT